jgi:hypothetical protein
MYNLMVTGGDNLWEEGAYVWHKSRILEHTEARIKAMFEDFSESALIKFASLPTLFMYERGAQGTPRVGRITQIKQRGLEFRVTFEFDESVPPLTLGQIDAVKWDLEIHDSEFARTHWAVKNADLNEVLAQIKTHETPSLHEALDRFKPDETLQELLAAIHRDLRSDKHAASLDRLHTYCMKKFAHLLERRAISYDRSEPLHSRVGKYSKSLQESYPLHEVSTRIIKSSIGVFEQFNDVRNNVSFAHDNPLIDKAEARFIFDSVISILRFIKTIEEDNFGS